VIDEETGYMLNLGVDFKSGQRVESMKALLARATTPSSWVAAHRAGATWKSPAARKPPPHIHIGIDWLASVSFGHITSVKKRVIVLGGGNTAMDCCRSARRLGAKDVKVVVRSGLRGNEGQPLGEGRRPARRHPHPQLPRAQGLHA
jgi:formate dehydrogenase beta subunit